MVAGLSLSFTIDTIDEKKALTITTPEGNRVSVIMRPFFIQNHLPPPDQILGDFPPVTDWTELSIPETGTETTTAKTYFISISRLQLLVDFPELKRGSEVLKAFNDKDTAKIISLLAQGTIHTKQRDLCIQLAGRDGLSEVIEPLFNNGPISQEAVSRAIWIAYPDHKEIAEWLLNKGQISEKDAGLIILEATKNKNNAMIALILAKAKISLEDRANAFTIACQNNETETISLLNHQEIPPQVHAINLYFATQNALKNTIAFLVANGKISQEARKEAVLMAIRNNKEEIVSLLDQGTLAEEARGAAIQLAAQLGHKDILKGLLQNEETSKKFREEALLSAIRNNKEDMVSFLDQGTLAEETRGKAIQLAAQLGHKEILKGLLQNEETSKKFREQALLSAIDGKQGDIVELLDQGTLTKETRGKAIKLAAHLGHKEILRVLLQNGEVSENDRYAAISAAQEKGDLAIKSILLLPPSCTLSPGAA